VQQRRDPGWGILGRVLGALTGAAALAYFVGAVTMYARFRLKGFNPDLGLEHIPSQQLVALGIKTIVGVVALAAVPLGMAAFILWRLVKRGIAEGLITVLIGAGGVIVVSLAWDSWLWLGIDVGFVLSLLAIVWSQTRSFHGRPLPVTALLSVFILSAVIVGVGYGVNLGHFNIAGVRLTPPPPRSKGIDLPYFGQDGTYLYVPEVTSSGTNPDGSHWFNTDGRILAVPTRGLTMAFAAQSDFMNYRVRTPARFAQRVLSGARNWAGHHIYGAVIVLLLSMYIGVTYTRDARRRSSERRCLEQIEAVRLDHHGAA
jgi:hypothetical protein